MRLDENKHNYLSFGLHSILQNPLLICQIVIYNLSEDFV